MFSRKAAKIAKEEKTKKLFSPLCLERAQQEGVRQVLLFN